MFSQKNIEEGNVWDRFKTSKKIDMKVSKELNNNILPLLNGELRQGAIRIQVSAGWVPGVVGEFCSGGNWESQKQHNNFQRLFKTSNDVILSLFLNYSFHSILFVFVSGVHHNIIFISSLFHHIKGSSYI